MQALVDDGNPPLHARYGCGQGEGLAVVLLGVGVLVEEGFHLGQPHEAVGFGEAVEVRL